MKWQWFVVFVCLGIGSGYGKTVIIGEVTKVDAENSSLTVQPTDPRGPPIALKVSSGDIHAGYLNKKIRGTLVTEVQPAELQGIWPFTPEFEKRVTEINLAHMATSLTPNAPGPIKVGDEIPPFALYDQEGNPVTHKDVIGKIIVMNFIFTRCGIPTACPAATKKMVELQKMVKDHLLQDDVRFITISFDPENDTPGMLNQYAHGFNIDLSNYSFLTGDAEMIRRLTRIFGIYALSENGMVNHTMKTVIIDKRGRVIYGTSQFDWEPKALLDVIRKIQKA